ncbi:MAG: radical SAM protein [Rhodospirillales bacterium]|nr:radical SAM protein [Rhodospirillales bacterium]
MSAIKIALIGHMVPNPVSMPLSTNPARAKTQMQAFNYTRVLTEDDRLIDHIAYLKEKKGLPPETPFSVWEMYLCAQLLLAQMLKAHGFEVKIINFIDDHNAEKIWTDLHDFAPDIIAASTTFVLTFKQFMGLGQTLRKQFPNTFLMAGGHHVFTTLNHATDETAKSYLRDTGFDAFVVDPQGEHAMLQIAQTYPNRLNAIPNLVIRDGNDIVLTHRSAEDNDINFTLSSFENILPGSIANVRTARSCSFKCAFCSYPSVAGPLATLSMENVRLTLKRIMDAKLSAIFFVDDTFNVPKDRFENVLNIMIEIGFNIPWYSFIRAQYIDEKIVAKMKSTGCAGVYLGIESGSNDILKAMKKGAIIDFYKRGIAWLKQANILTVGSFIMGFPGETEHTVQITQRFIEESDLDYYYIQPFYYLHHTPVEDRAQEYGLQGEGAFWSHNTMNWVEATAHVNRIFMEIDNVTFINPDYTLWEIAYLRAKGMTLEEIKSYRDEINTLTRNQMTRFGLTEANALPRVTSRSGYAQDTNVP